MEELVKLMEKDGVKLVSARELHNFLQVSQRFSQWFERFSYYVFEVNKDYIPYQIVYPQNNREIIDYDLTLDCAKGISMLQRSEK